MAVRSYLRGDDVMVEIAPFVFVCQAVAEHLGLFRKGRA